MEPHELKIYESRIATLEAEARRFAWLAERLSFDVSIDGADPCDFADEDVTPLEAWRLAIDMRMEASND